MKKSWILILSIVLAAALSIGSTVAYLQDADSDVNVMTLGKVDIVQVEEERSGDELVKFDNYNKTLFPGVYSEAKPVTGTDGYYAAQNAIDKIVSVDNEGKSDAYVRTIFAFEQGTMTDARFEEVMNINKNESGDWTWTKIGNSQTIGAKPGVYTVYVAVYNEILPKGESTSESLKQVLLAKEGTNEDVKALDANGNQMYEILVLSQAVQSMGFESMGAAEALNEAFGAVDQAHLNEWMGGMEAEGPTAGSALDLQRIVAAMSANGGAQTVTLTEDITLNSALTLEKGSLTINLGGHTLTLSDAATSGWNPLYSTAKAGSGWGFSVGKNATLTIIGAGKVQGNGLSSLFNVLGSLNLNVTGTIGGADYVVNIGGGSVSIQSGDFSYSSGLAQKDDSAVSGKVDISGGSFPQTREEVQESLGEMAGTVNGGSFAGEATPVKTYADLKAAFALANQGNDVKIKLDANLTVTGDDMDPDEGASFAEYYNNCLILKAGTLTLDLNNHDLTMASNAVSDGFMNVNGGHLTVKGTGNIYSDHFAVFYLGGNEDNGESILTMNINGTVDSSKNVFFVGGTLATLTIENGVYEADGRNFTHMDGRATIKINGGEFKNTKAAIEEELSAEHWQGGNCFDYTIADGVKFAEAGSEGDDSEEIYVTLGSELMEVVASVNEGNTVKVKLGGNITLLQKITLSQGHLILSGEYDLATNCETLFNMAGGDLTLNVTGKVSASLDECATFEMGSADSDVIINSGEYQNMIVCTGAAASLTINGGSFDITREKLEAQCAIEYPEWNVEATNLTINGGTFATN